MAVPYNDRLGVYTAGNFVNGISQADSWMTFATNSGDAGTLSSALTEGTHLDMICLSENGNRLVKATVIDSPSTFTYTILDGSSNAEIQTYFEAPLNFFKVILKNTDIDSEWYHYNNGGAYPYVPPVDVPMRVTRAAVEVLLEEEVTTYVRITRQAVEVLAKAISPVPPARREITVTYTDFI